MIFKDLLVDDTSSNNMITRHDEDFVGNSRLLTCHFWLSSWYFTWNCQEERGGDDLQMAKHPAIMAPSTTMFIGVTSCLFFLRLLLSGLLCLTACTCTRKGQDCSLWWIGLCWRSRRQATCQRRIPGSIRVTIVSLRSSQQG